METESPTELTQTIETQRREATALRETVEQAMIAYRDCQPRYNELAADYERRKAAATDALDGAIRRANAWSEGAGPKRAVIARRLDGPDGLNLSSSDWQTASAAAPLAQQLM